MPGYNEEEIKRKDKEWDEKYKKMKKDKEEIVWNNVAGETIRMSYHKHKKYFKMKDRIDKEAPVFGMKYLSDDCKTRETGTATTTYNSNTGTATTRMDTYTSMTEFCMKQEYALEDERLIELARVWLKNLRTISSKFWLFVQIFLFIGCIELIATPEIGQYITLAVVGLIILAIVIIFSVKNLVCDIKRKNAVKKAKNIWKEINNK